MGCVLTLALRLFAIVSAVVSLLCLALSGMASDDVSRLPQAHVVQGLQLAWLAASILTPIVAAVIARRDIAASHRAYIPMVVIGIGAFVALAKF